jgi:hypothetical protein
MEEIYSTESLMLSYQATWRHTADINLIRNHRKNPNPCRLFPIDLRRGYTIIWVFDYTECLTKPVSKLRSLVIGLFYVKIIITYVTYKLSVQKMF